jgi:hypothetical protein
MTQRTNIPAKVSLAAAAVAVSLAAIAAPLTAAPLTQTATDEATLYVASIQSAGTVAVSDDSLSEAEVADILFMREEEKVARDVYMTLGHSVTSGLSWVNPFENTQRGTEQLRMSQERVQA